MLYISNLSALEFWLNGTGRENLKISSKRDDFSAKLATYMPDFGLSLSTPVTVVTASRGFRNSNDSIKKVLLPANLPRGSFCRINSGLSVACPELCFLQAARHYSFEILVRIGNQLCATYVFDENQQFLQRNRIPITSVAEIKKYLASAEGAHGKKKALAALQYVSDNCGSPMECKIATVLFLPFCRGGYGVVRGACNKEIRLSSAAKNIYRGKSCRGDIVWEAQKVIFEYDSSMTHIHDDQRRFDAHRQSIMNNLDYKVVRLTEDDLKNFTTFEKAMSLLYKNLKTFPHNATMEKYHELRRKVFISVLKNTNVM